MANIARAPEGDYFQWLCDRIKGQNHKKLLGKLYSVDYTIDFVMDSNRTAAGLTLRDYFCYEKGVDPEDVEFGGCSVLELLQGLAGSISKMMGDTTLRWFWEIMDNLDLSRFDDSHYSERGVDERLSRWLSRNYTSRGVGSPFPFKSNRYGDARNMELWAQMNIYLNEYERNYI